MPDMAPMENNRNQPFNYVENLQENSASQPYLNINEPRSRLKLKSLKYRTEQSSPLKLPSIGLLRSEEEKRAAPLPHQFKIENMHNMTVPIHAHHASVHNTIEP